MAPNPHSAFECLDSAQQIFSGRHQAGIVFLITPEGNDVNLVCVYVYRVHGFEYFPEPAGVLKGYKQPFSG